MDKQKVMEKVRTASNGNDRPQGGIATIYTHKIIPTTKGNVEKKSVFQIRGGINYENTAQVKVERANGKPKDPHALAWFTRDNPWCGFHNKNGRQYLVGQPLAPLNDRSVRRSKFYLDGVQLSGAEVAALIPERERTHKDSKWATIPLDSITDIR